MSLYRNTQNTLPRNQYMSSYLEGLGLTMPDTSSTANYIDSSLNTMGRINNIGLPDTSFVNNYIVPNQYSSQLPSTESLFSAWDAVNKPSIAPKININTSGIGNGQGIPTGQQTGTNGMSFGDKMNLGLGLGLGAIGAFNAYNQNKLAKRQFAFEKDAFNRNFDAQKNITNSQLEDRARARYLVDPVNSMSVSEYMAKFGVK